jgi:23S rRNA pseudouridine2457 synthase
MSSIGHRYFVVHKPRKMVSQFISAHKVKLLGDLVFDFPEGTHAIGRLDNNSEGILLLTTNKRVTSLLFQGETAHKRVYVVLVTGLVTDDTLVLLRNGVTVQDKDSTFYTTSPCEVELITKPPYLHDDKYIYREKVPHSWLQITLTEGKYHQVRRMFAAGGATVLARSGRGTCARACASTSPTRGLTTASVPAARAGTRAWCWCSSGRWCRTWKYGRRERPRTIQARSLSRALSAPAWTIR